MTADSPALIHKYYPKGILLDSNLLVLWYVGLVSPESVRDSKRTRNQGFTEIEFSLLQKIIRPFKRVITTPHILTETSNYICQLKGGTRQRAQQFIAETIPSFKERRPEAKNLVKTKAFHDFGLTDSAVLDLPPKKYLVLSVDAALVVALNKKGVDAINFHHLRLRAWGL